MGSPVSEVPLRLRENRWRNVSHIINCRDLTKLGCQVTQARYVGGVRPKQFCNVVVASRPLSVTRQQYERIWRRIQGK
jgi:hypothetical protein